MANDVLQCPLSDRANGQELAIRDTACELTYKELDALVNGVETMLRSFGVSKGAIVTFEPDHTVITVATFWACFRLGACAWPRTIERAAASREQQPNAIHVSISDLARSTPTSSSARREIQLGADATLIETSGSTAEPKAALHTVSAHVASARGSARNIPLAPGDAWALSLPLAHVGGIAIIFRTLLGGATINLVDPGAIHLDPGLATHYSLVPTQLHRMVDKARDLFEREGTPDWRWTDSSRPCPALL